MYTYIHIQLKKEFSSEVESAIAAFRAITVDSSAGHADLTHLFKVANHEATKSRSHVGYLGWLVSMCKLFNNSPKILTSNVIMIICMVPLSPYSNIYCRPSVVPKH